MDFFNTTSIPALNFMHRNERGEMRNIVVAAASYHIEKDGSILEISPQPKINFEEQAFGDPERTSIRRESDLAPEKPLTDLVIVANAHSPGGKPLKRFPVLLTVREPNGTGSDSRGETIRQLALIVTGARQWRIKSALHRAFGRVLSIATLGIVQPDLWTLTEPTPTTEVPLRHEYAYGGSLKIIRATEPNKKPLDFTYSKNPLGCGYLPNVHDFKKQYGVGLREARACLRNWARLHPRFAAPQLENTTPLSKQPDEPYGVLGWGVIPKHWSPRIELAGTFDVEWKEKRHPLLPRDFNPLYWNGANIDLRFSKLPNDAVIELKNIIPHTRKPDQTVVIRLPGMSLQAEYHDVSQRTPQTTELTMDTIHIDLQKNILTLLFRGNFPEIGDPGYLAVSIKDKNEHS